MTKKLELNSYENRFAASLKAKREKAKLRPEELAEKLGVSWQAIYTWEAGTRSPAIKMLPEIAAALGCSIHSLVPKE